jgi:hypothetical protein
MRLSFIVAAGGDRGCQHDRFDELPFEYRRGTEPQLIEKTSSGKWCVIPPGSILELDN